MVTGLVTSYGETAF